MTSTAKKKQNLMSFITKINDEDVEAIENLQLGLVNSRQPASDFQGEFLPQYDWPVHRYQNMVLSAVTGNKWAETEKTIMPELSNSFDDKVKQEMVRR